MGSCNTHIAFQASKDDTQRVEKWAYIFFFDQIFLAILYIYFKDTLWEYVLSTVSKKISFKNSSTLSSKKGKLFDFQFGKANIGTNKSPTSLLDEKYFSSVMYAKI